MLYLKSLPQVKRNKKLKINKNIRFRQKNRQSRMTLMNLIETYRPIDLRKLKKIKKMNPKECQSKCPNISQSTLMNDP